MGPILAFAVIPFIGIRGVFLLSFVPAAIALAILLFFVRDSAGSAGRSSIFQNAREVLNRRFILLLLTLGVFAVGAYNFSFILLKAGDLGLSESHIPLVYAAINVGAVVLGIPAGILADRIGKVPVLGLSYIIFIVTSLGGLLLAGNPLYAFLIAFLFGSYLAISETVQRAIIPDFAKPQLKGTAYAIYYSVIGSGSLVANVVFGGLWSSIGPTAAFQYSVAAGIVGFLVLVTFLIREARQVH
jgi:predicted MFS family arabinose efflux permease